MLYTNYLANKLVDVWLRAVAYTFPTTLALGLLTTTKGPRGNSTVYALNDTLSLTANDGKTHMYKVTTLGTSAAAQSTLYPGVANEAITDGTAVMTEQNSALRAGIGGVVLEAAYTNYARSAQTGNATNWAATNGATTTTSPSTGTGAPGSSNNALATFGTTAGSGPTFVWAEALFDAATTGNMLVLAPLTAVKTINNADPAPTTAISAFVIGIDSL